MRVLVSAVSATVLGMGITAAAYADAYPRYQGAPFGWTGFYVGGNVGWAWSDARITDVDSYAAAAVPGTVTTVKSDGFFGGGQIGYNFQSGPLVLGIEADLGGMDIGRSRLLTGSVSGTRVGQDSGLYGDVTGRVGFAAARTLFYAKGGWAFFDGTERFSTVTGSFSGKTDTGTFNGWTLGAGIEHMLDRYWSVKVEYQHFDFGREDFTVLNAASKPFRFKDDLEVDTVKIGLNYKFGAREDRVPLK
jgi:outer membrane immunogenic protein